MLRFQGLSERNQALAGNLHIVFTFMFGAGIHAQSRTLGGKRQFFERRRQCFKGLRAQLHMRNRGCHAPVKHAGVANRQIDSPESLRQSIKLDSGLLSRPRKLRHTARRHQIVLTRLIQRLKFTRILQALIRLIVVVPANRLCRQKEDIRESAHKSLSTLTRPISRVFGHQKHHKERRNTTDHAVKAAGKRQI